MAITLELKRERQAATLADPDKWAPSVSQIIGNSDCKAFVVLKHDNGRYTVAEAAVAEPIAEPQPKAETKEVTDADSERQESAGRKAAGTERGRKAKGK
jgi:hypothetical protein